MRYGDHDWSTRSRDWVSRLFLAMIHHHMLWLFLALGTSHVIGRQRSQLFLSVIHHELCLFLAISYVMWVLIG